MTTTDPALILGLRATFTTEELTQLHADAVEEQDAVANPDPWLRLIDVLFAAANPRDTCNCHGCQRRLSAASSSPNTGTRPA